MNEPAVSLFFSKTIFRFHDVCKCRISIVYPLNLSWDKHYGELLWEPQQLINRKRETPNLVFTTVIETRLDQQNCLPSDFPYSKSYPETTNNLCSDESRSALSALSRLSYERILWTVKCCMWYVYHIWHDFFF